MNSYSFPSTGGVRLTTLDDWYGVSVLDALLNHGARVHTRDFDAPAGQKVTVFWTADRDGRVRSVFEHTYTPSLVEGAVSHA